MKTYACIACFVCLAKLVTCAAAQENDAGVLTVKRISKLPRQILSCELNYKFHDRRGDRISTRSIAVEGEKFFIDIGRSQAGFDGEEYWSKDPRRPAPRIEKASFLGFKQLDTHPLNAPYGWVWGDPKKACWSDLQHDATWKSVGERMTYQATRTIHNQTCDVYVVDYPDSAKKYTVAFSRRLGGFPIQISLEINGEHFSTGDVLEAHRVGDAVIATKGQAKNKFNDEPIDWIDVDVDSIQVNQSLDPAVFQP